jgi:hypothetical protein
MFVHISGVIMRFLPVVVGTILATMAVSQVDAAAPNSIVALLGPSIGYRLAQSDLCGWSLSDKIHAAYQSGFQQIGMTETQQAAAWAEAKTRQTKLTTLPEEAKARMKADICTPDMRAQVEHELAE